ncbi:ubiquinol-cytochrome-c reductase complex subunit 6 [Phaffia rhodozyma]|uniref:Complex III subunit 7 n=1 Tax=Phaffia rhodozyma TaxID=264483 RepID=A0A0F7SV59_PHARH|nr:ubiquinol-cytochrome-c reductase complex subunit 6 [Phaffia rhodozyma]
MPLIWGPLGVSAYDFIAARPRLLAALKPIANIWVYQAGYRQLGLRYDDIIEHENMDVQKALGRLTAREGYDRVYRLRRAIQQEIIHRDLPESEWTKPEDDIRYLTPHIKNIVAEKKERAAWDNLTVKKSA